MKGRLAVTFFVMIVIACTSCTNSQNSSAVNSATLTVAMAAVPQTLDTNPFGGQPMAFVDSALESTLFAYDTSKVPGNGCSQMGTLSNVVGSLADSWTFNSDRTVITIKLKNAKSAWGHELTADDVVYSFARNLSFKSVGQGVLQSDTHYSNNPATVVDQHTVQLHLDESSAIDLPVLTVFVTRIYDSQELKAHATAADPWASAWLQTNTADFGPWKLESFVPGALVSFVPNPNYTGARGNITHLIFNAIPNPSSRANILQTGGVDWAIDVSPADFKNLQGKPGVATMSCASPNRVMLVLNFADQHFSNVLVRQAISLAIDRQAINLGAYEGLAKPAEYGVSTNYAFTHPSTKYLYDTTQAKSLLAQAGYPNGFTMPLTYSPTRPGPQATQMAVLIKDQLSQIGINVTLDNVASNSTFINDFYGPNYQAILYSEPSAVADIYYSAEGYTLSTSSQDLFGWKDSAYDQLIHTIGATQPGPAREQLIQQLATDIVNKVPLIYILDTSWLYTYRSNIKGFNSIPYGVLVPSQMTKD